MPRGGRRQGTPGKGYANRTDLASKPDMTQNTAASGGMEPPSTVGAGGMSPLPQGLPSPDDTPMLTDPTNYPDEPITAGLPIGAGPGPTRDTRLQETKNLKRYLPIVAPYLDQPDTPDSVRALFRYIRGS